MGKWTTFDHFDHMIRQTDAKSLEFYEFNVKNDKTDVKWAQKNSNLKILVLKMAKKCLKMTSKKSRFIEFL